MMSGYIKVSHSELCYDAEVLLPLKEDVLERETLKSQFPSAVGLRYHVGGVLKAVAADTRGFSSPDGGWGTRRYIVVTTAECAGQARDIIGNRPSTSGLAQQITSVFKSSKATSHPRTHFSPIQGAASRKDIRQQMKKKKKLFEKSYKVVFIGNIKLPGILCADIILEEGLINISSEDTEDTIKNKLLDIFDSTDKDPTKIIFLSCSHKKLSKPNVPSTFKFDGIGLKALIGQGKLYVLVEGPEFENDKDMMDQNKLDDTDMTDEELPVFGKTHSLQIPQADTNASMNSDQENTGSSAKPQTDITKTVQSQDIVEGDPEDTGTPTITFHPSCLERRERRSRLSLRSSTGNDALACPSTYRSYVQLFETEIVTVDDSDDEGDKTIPMDGDISLPELLIKLQSQVDLEKITKFNINRNLVLDGARRAIKRKSFCAKSKISVKFTDDVGIAEGAVDEGGPKREFLRMLMKKIQYLHIFEGPENRRILAYSTSALEDNLYRDVGLFFSLSIVHGGPSPKFLSPVMYNALVGQAGERNIEDIADGDLRGEVQKLKDASSLQDLNKQMNAMSTLLITAGCFRPILNMQQKDKLIMDIVRFLVLERTSTPLHQLRDGLQTLDVLTYIQEHYKAFKDLFVCQGNEKLTAEMMEVVFMDIKMSVPGSNRRRDEENIVGYWRDFLIDLQEDEDGEITLGDVLSFATGADCVPPLGFDPSPSITFLHDSGLFPKANTCSMELKLPVSEDFNTFKKNMTFGIANSPGFGLA
ncbi:uncharacterized protein LOC134725640 [Mytilus trossulus]|uniref:uncharacterized protein LOC134725640 n=1 Tax=Mytilus trossulus TaxID=6551 RepID=UPI003004FE60